MEKRKTFRQTFDIIPVTNFNIPLLKKFWLMWSKTGKEAADERSWPCLFMTHSQNCSDHNPITDNKVTPNFSQVYCLFLFDIFASSVVMISTHELMCFVSWHKRSFISLHDINPPSKSSGFNPLVQAPPYLHGDIERSKLRLDLGICRWVTRFPLTAYWECSSVILFLFVVSRSGRNDSTVSP